MLLELPRHVAALRAVQMITDGGERRAVLVLALTPDAPAALDGLRFHTATDRLTFLPTLPETPAPLELPEATPEPPDEDAPPPEPALESLELPAETPDA